MTPEQQAACLADVNSIIAYERVAASGRVYEQSGWTDPETNEEYGPDWVAEIRIRRPGAMRVVFLDAEQHAADRDAWCEILSFEINSALGRWWRKRR